MESARVSITYCSHCQWLLRAAWLAQELLMTFGDDLSEVALRPGTGGIFEIRLGMSYCGPDRVRGGFRKPRRSSSACAIALIRPVRLAMLIAAAAGR